MRSRTELPERIESVEGLEELMTRPTDALVADLARLPGDILVLGVAGKMGPTLAGIGTIACDLLDRAAVEALPEAENVVFMAGRKFGTLGQEELTWAMNVLAPALVAERFKPRASSPFRGAASIRTSPWARRVRPS